MADYSRDGIVFPSDRINSIELAAGGPIAHPDAQVVLMTQFQPIRLQVDLLFSLRAFL